MHKVSAFVTIIHPAAIVNYFVANVAVSFKIAVHVRNGVDKRERVMMISRS